MAFLSRDEEIEECKKNFNHIGIYGGTILCRLIGFGEDDEDSYYYTMDVDGKKVFCSMVGEFFSIKNIGEEGYKYIDANISYHCPEAKEFTIRNLEEEL
jgi:hypothetical protein